MPVTLSKIASNTAHVTLRVGDDSVTVVYFPSRITEKIFTQLQAFSGMNEDTITEEFAAFNKMLANLIKSWDVYEDDAQTNMFPIDAERFAELPLAFRIQILQSIMGDFRPEAMGQTAPLTQRSRH
jgi:hypothetical protein